MDACSKIAERRNGSRLQLFALHRAPASRTDLFEKIKVVSERTVPGEVSRQQIADDGGTTTIGCGAVASIEWSHSDWIYPVPGFNIAFVEMAGDWDAVTPRFAPVQPETQTLR